jgi:ABC-type Zn uptake system ZnuABC Zn-binding protein ZnuA
MVHVAAAALLISSGCGAAPGRSGDVRVVTTISPITNLVQNVGGDRIVLTGLVPEGVDSHTFEPAPTDARVLAEADVVFLNGLHLEEPTRRLAEANVGSGVPIVELGSRTIDRSEYIYDFSFPRAQGDPNPHLWTNPPHARRYAEIILETLSKTEPANAPYYRANFAELGRRLEQLDRAVREATATVTPGNRKLLTYHDSFPYFAREYGWEVIGAVQPSDFTEPTAAEVARLIDQIRRERIPAIFGSEVFPSPVLEQIARESGARYVDALRDDDLPGDPGDPDHSYLGLMVSNLRIMVGALGGDVAPFDRIDVANIAGDAAASYTR